LPTPPPSCSTAPASTSPPWATSTRSPPTTPTAVAAWSTRRPPPRPELAGPRTRRDNGWIPATAPAEGGTMASATLPTTIGDLLEGLGGTPARRVLFKPTPGTATEEDLIEIHARTNRRFELVDGTLVEKALGFDEARLGFLLASYLQRFLERHDL